MTRREHVVLRLGALALLAFAAWFPRSSSPHAQARTRGEVSTTTLTSATLSRASVATDAPVEVASLGRFGR